jgi:hypothetical protein
VRLPVLHQRMEPRDLLSLGGCSRKGQHSAGAADSLVGFHLMVGNGVGSCDGGLLGVLSDDAAVSSIAARMAQRLMCLCVCVCCRRCRRGRVWGPGARSGPPQPVWRDSPLLHTI